MKNIKNNSLDILESVESQLSEDIQTLGYLQDEYFIYDKPENNFKYEYQEIQNKLMTLSKSMSYNKIYIQDCIKRLKGVD